MMLSSTLRAGTAKQVQGVRRCRPSTPVAVKRVQPLSIDAAQALVMLSPGHEGCGSRLMSPSLPAPTRQFMAAFFDAAGNPTR